MSRRQAGRGSFGRVLALSVVVASPTMADLPPDVARRVESAVMDLVRGRAAEAHEKLQPLLEIGAPAQQQEIDALLKRFRVQEPLGPLVAGLRIEAVAAAGSRPSKTLKPMGPVEAGFVQKAVEARLDGMLEPIDKELEIGFRVDAATEALEEQLARCTSLLDQMDAIERLQALQSDAGRQARVKGAKNAAKKEVAQHKTRRDQLVTRIVEIAIAVIPDQMQVLRDDGAAYADRAKSAARLEDCFAVAKMYFPKYRAAKKGTGKSLGGKTVGQQDGMIKELEREFDRVAGPLRLKIYHFEQGKQWWLRGRWGVGPYHDGQTKAAVGRNTFEAFLFYPLLLPDPIPKPVNAFKDARPLPVARRHLDVWKAALPTGQAFARAERNLRIAQQAWKLTIPPPGQTSLNYLRVVESDEDFNPFVGYLEYQMALYHWGRLLALAGDAELKGLEKSLAEDDRFVIHSYLSRQYDAADPNSTLKLSPPKSDDPRAADVYERRGLSWCIALAQIEVAGVRAVYTGLEYEPRLSEPEMPRDIPPGMTVGWVEDRFPAEPAIPLRRPRSTRPFDRVVPTPFTQQALAELMWDGMRQQYYRVRTEIAVANNQVSNLNEFLPPIVRLAVALEFVRAYRQRFGATLTQPQLKELQGWENFLQFRLGQLAAAWSNGIKVVSQWLRGGNPANRGPLPPQQVPRQNTGNPPNPPGPQKQGTPDPQGKQKQPPAKTL